MAKKIIKGGIPDDSINTVFDNTPSSTIYKLGDFRLEGNFEQRKIVDYSYKSTNFSKEYTLESFTLDKTLSDKIYRNIKNFKLNVDYSDITSYSIYGSLKDKFEYSVLNIVDKFPYSLYANNVINNTNYLTVLNYTFDPKTNKSNFDVPVVTLTNVGNLIVDSGNFVKNEKLLKNLNVSKTDYVIGLINVTGETEYKVLDFVGDISTDTYLNFTVEGNPFTGSTVSKIYHIKPKKEKYFEFINDLSDLEKYFLSLKKDKKYLINLKKPTQNTAGLINYSDKYLEWTFFDGYNIDISGFSYNNFLKELINIGIDYDNFKSDTIYRMYTTTSLKHFDETSSKKIKLLTRLYGHTFDKVKELIDGFSRLNTLSYNKNKSVPNILVKNLSRTFGWDVKTIVKETDLLKNIFSFTQGDLSESKIPYEIDIELWRRILINSNYLFKSKGTRNSIISFFKLIGIPEEFIELNEYVYMAEKPLSFSERLPYIKDFGDFSEIELEEENRPSYNSSGYPIAVRETGDFYFQVSGNTDFGQHYLNRFRRNGFKISKINDNKKTWVYTETQETRVSDASSYFIKDSKLVINTKEISVGLSTSGAEDNLVYKNDVATTLSFNEYLNKVVEEYIDVKNRKIISDNLGGTYPKLSALYYDYINANPNFKYKNLYNFIKRFDEFFIAFLDQLIPATVIQRGYGFITKNNEFLKQKHRYIRGINDGAEYLGNTNFLTCTNFYIQAIDTVNPTGNMGGYIGIIVTSGNPDYQYSIDDGITYQNSHIFNDLEPDTYNVKVKDNIGCIVENTVELTLECNVLITNLEVEMVIPIIERDPVLESPTEPPKPSPTPIATSEPQVCPLGLLPALFAGPYTTSTEACLLSPDVFALGGNLVDMYIDEEANQGSYIDYSIITTAWRNCDNHKAGPASSGYYSNGTGWFYVSNIVGPTGTNVSAGGSCSINESFV